MFIGREKELQTLNKVYDSTSSFRMCVIYGRRRVGKSTLISEFIKNKNAIYYTATKVGNVRNIQLFTQEVLHTLQPSLKNIHFDHLEELFDFMTINLPETPLVLIIDELPYWAKKDESILSTLQKYADHDWKEKNLFLILCGSSLSFMEEEVLSEKSPLFGRRNSQIKLNPFNYLDAAKFVPNYSYEDKAICYGVTGGIPKYLELFDSKKSLEYNLKSLFFDPNGYLYDEPRNLLIQEFSDTTVVNNIIEQIASGENSINTIASKIGESEANVSYSLNKLISVGLVEKKKCITEEKNKKKTQYVLKDSMFQFWYNFIPAAASSIERGYGEQYYEAYVSSQLHTFMGSVFEEMCRDYTAMLGFSNVFDCIITDVGTWWGIENYIDDNGKKIHVPTDIDVVGISKLSKCVVLGECKFKNEKIGKSVYDTFLRRSQIFSSKYQIKKLILFSLNGFTDWFKDNKDENILCISLDDMYK